MTSPFVLGPKSVELISRRNDINKRQSEIDFELSKWCGDARAQFKEGEPGDNDFMRWCACEFGDTVLKQKELLLRAKALAIVPDRTVQKKLHGFREVRHLVEVEPRLRQPIISEALSNGNTVRSVMRSRGIISEHRVSYEDDARLFAEFIDGCGVRPPPKVKEALKRYIPQRIRA